MRSFIFALCSALFASAVEFPFGGETFPMEEISARRFASVAMSAGNLLKNGDLKEGVAARETDGWAVGSWIFREQNRAKFDKTAKPLAIREIYDSPDGRVMRLVNGQDIETLMGDEIHNFTTCFSQIVTLPAGKSRSYTFSFEHFSRKIGEREHTMHLIISRKDASHEKPGRGKMLGSLISQPIPLVVEWTPYIYTFQVPDETRDLSIVLRSDGAGELNIRKPRLEAVSAPRHQLTAELAAMGLLDNVYALAQGQPGVFEFRLKSNVPQKDFSLDKTEVVLEFPASVRVVGTNRILGEGLSSTDFQKDGKAWKQWRIDCDETQLRHISNSSGEFVGWGVPSLLLLSDDRPGQDYSCSFQLEQKGKACSNRVDFTLRIMEPIPHTPMSKLFPTGISVVSHDFNFRQKEARELLAAFIADTGNSIVNCGLGEEFNATLRNAGVRYVTSETGHFCNGHIMGNWGIEHPDYAVFRNVDGKPFKRFVCPASVYKKTPYFTDILVPLLKKTLNTQDGLMPNWEPYSTRGEGCFCDVCKAEFARYAKLSQAEVDAAWPKGLQVGGKYHESAIRFRGWQHAKVVKLLNELTCQFGGTEIGFCPEVGTDQAILYDRNFEEQGEFSIYDYAADLKWLNVWGPYVWFIADQPYTYTKGAYLRAYEAARRVNRDFHSRLPQAKTKLMAMPHGNQCSITALGQPEGIAMDQLSSFLAGYDASISYFFPRGYDHRFWAALAYATRQIADNEATVMKRHLRAGVTASPLTPFPAPVANISPVFLSDVTQSDLLQCLAFEDNDGILVAVGNFWTKGDVVFRLRVPGLAKEGKYTVLQNEYHRQFLRDGGKSFSGADLSEGILLHAGALRWAFFRIQPEVASDFEAIPAAELIRLAQIRSAANQKAAAHEAELDRKLHAENDCGTLLEMDSGKLHCRPVTIDSRQMLELTSGANRLVLSTCGLAIHSWTIGGVEQMDPLSTRSYFWNPGVNGCEVAKIFHVDEQKALPGSMSITGSVSTGPKLYPELPEIKVTRSLECNEDLTRIKVTARLSNPTELSMEDVGYRWWLGSYAWSNTNNGYAVIDGKTFRRPRQMTVLPRNANDFTRGKIRKLFQVKSPDISMKASTFQLVYPGKRTLQVSLEPQEEFAGLAIWDTSSLIMATLEPFYTNTRISPGQSKEYTLSLELLP